MPRLDGATAALVRLSARITSGTEAQVRQALASCAEAGTAERWIEELLLQSYLFAGFPRTLNAAREWRRSARPVAPVTAAGAVDDPPRNEGYADVYEWRVRGEATCRTVYAKNFEKLRSNIRGLHPALDEWMIVEGYGKVLSRDGLDLARRELCIIAACASAGQDRQLQSHLHGALNAGASPEDVDGTLDALEGVVGADDLRRARLLWARIRSA